MIEVVSFDYKETDLAAHSSALRKEVFVDEQGVPSELEYDGSDAEAHHYLLFVDKMPIATARWRTTPQGVKLERFALKKEYRNKGYGVYILEAVMSDVLLKNRPVYLHAQEKAVNFYKRFGFVVKGDAFEEAGIRHYKMVWVKHTL